MWSWVPAKRLQGACLSTRQNLVWNSNDLWRYWNVTRLKFYDKMCSVGGQPCKTQTADYCFHHTNKYVTIRVPLYPKNNSPLSVRLAHKSSFWARSASERKLDFVPGPTTPDQKTKRTTLRKSSCQSVVCILHCPLCWERKLWTVLMFYPSIQSLNRYDISGWMSVYSE